MAICKGCGASIIWIRSARGKPIPCEPDPVPYWVRPGASKRVVTPNGEVRACEFDGEPNDAYGTGYFPHWANCPAAGKFRARHGGEAV